MVKPKTQKVENMAKEMFDSIPSIFFPENKIIYKDHSDTIKQYEKMIDRTTKDCIAIIMAPGGWKTNECIRYTRSLNKELNARLRLLCPSFRVALAMKQYEDLEVKHYGDVKNLFETNIIN